MDYLVREHFNEDSGEFARHTQYTEQRIAGVALSKPVGNKVLGTLKRSAPPKEG